MKNLSRRSFIKSLGLSVGAGVIITSMPSFIGKSALSGKKYEGRKLNIALCGLGNYSTNHLAIGLESSQYCRLAVIITGTPSYAEEWKKKYNLPEKNIYNYQNFDKIINNEAFYCVGNCNISNGYFYNGNVFMNSTSKS